MIIKYYSASESYIVERDLSKEKITEWWIDTTSDYKPLGWLSILFDTTGIETPCTGGVCPPIKAIINFKEVMEYLNNNFNKIEGVVRCFNSEKEMNAYILKHDIKGHIFINKKPDTTCKIRYFKHNENI